MLLCKRSLFLSGLAGLLFFPALAAAQVAAPTFSISTTPQYPQPGEAVTVEPKSDTIDLSIATMQILVNGTKAYDGNASSASVSLAASGATTIKVILSVDGKEYTKSTTLLPQSVGLVVEPNASAPPLYAGKPLIPSGGNVRIVATASFVTAKGTPLDPTKLSYTWTVNDRTISGISGIGKSAITVDAPLEYRSGSVSVVVKSPDGSLVGGDHITLSSQKPSVRVYEKDSLLGILFDHALSDTQKITGSELSLYAAPYSFSTTGGLPTINWFLNTAAAQAGNTITLRPTGNGQGTASVSCTARKGDFAVASQALSVDFGSSKSSNFFGL